MIRAVTKEEVEHLLVAGKKSGLCFCSSTEYFGYFHNDELVAMTGLIVYANKLVFKNSFVLEAHRRTGIYRKLFNYRVEVARSKGIGKIEATCTRMSLPMWISEQAEIIAEYKYYTKVRITL